MPVVDLTAYDFLTNVVLTLGWILSNKAWMILETSMLAAAPFIALVVREAYEARLVGEDEGSKGVLSLNRIETKLYVMLLVYLFCAAPIMPVTFAPADYDDAHLATCGSHVATGTTTAPVGGSMGGVSPYIPVWWAFVHSVSRGVTNAMVSALPCQADYLYIRTEINNTAIQDPVLQREVARFERVCYGAAISKLFRHAHGDVGPIVTRDTGWIGSHYFLTTPGYYDSFSARRPVDGFPFDPATDSGRGTRPSQGGYPTCEQWWTAPDIGLKDRLHDQIDTTFWDNARALVASVGTLSWVEAQDYAIRGLLYNTSSARGVRVLSTSDRGFASDVIGAIAGAVGVGLGTIPAIAFKDVMARALSMVQHMVLMAIVIAIPFVIVLSGYSFKVAGVITFSYFGIVTMTFWLELADWLDNKLFAMVYGADAAWKSFALDLLNLYDRGVMGLVHASMLLILPMLWLAMLGWAGKMVGGGLGAAIEGGAKPAGDAGKKGGEKGQSAATGGKL